MPPNRYLIEPLSTSWRAKGACWRLGPCRLEARCVGNRPQKLSTCCKASGSIQHLQGHNHQAEVYSLHGCGKAGISWPCRSSVGVAMAAAVWSGPEASFDEEQSWWAASPLSWRTADEREQWRAEQQLFKQQQTQQVRKVQPSTPGAGLASVDQETIDTEQQWLQPPVLLEPPQY